MAPAGPPFLGVERSLTGRRWRSRLADERLGLALAQRLDVPEVVGRVLAGRGVGPDDGEAFLDPTLKRWLPDPSELRDMDVACARLEAAVRGGETVAVFGDYDVDGATSAALIARFLAAVGGRSRIYVPDRVEEGYGPNLPALLRLKEEGADLVVTVDCGTTAFGPLAGAAEAGLEVVVVDHHLAGPGLPQARAVVNPNRLDGPDGLGQLAAVGVAFLLIVGVNRALRRGGWYGQERPEPDLRRWLDLVALGTVCDVVPLTGVNRALVRRGLEVMGRRLNPGLAALADVARLDRPPNAYHAGYVLGPRINAGGRVGRPDLGARLLATDDADEARRLAEELDALNRERRAIEAEVQEAAIAAVEADTGAAAPAVLALAAGHGWHPGVIGIVAGRLKERYRRPALVVSVTDGIGKGSGRSLPGVDLGAAVTAARQEGLLIDGGGHAMAAGLTVAEDRLAALAEFLDERLGPAVEEARAADGLGFDGALTAGAATVELATVLERAGPFGAGNPEPRFAVAFARVVAADTVGDSHVRCVLADRGGGRLKAIAFRAREGALGPALLDHGGRTLHVAGHVRREHWRGREEVRLFVDDAALPGPA